MPVPEDYPDTKGACFTCGFLSKWTANVPGAPGCYEIDYTARIKGAAYGHLLADGEITTTPFCFRRVVSFEDEDEIGSLGDRSMEEFEKATAEVFRRDRQCPKWHPYRAGVAPQAHLEELRMLELQQRQEQFQETLEQRRETYDRKMEQERREWDDKREQERRSFEAGLQERYHGFGKWIALGALALALAEVVAAVFGAGPNSLIGDWLGLD